MHPYDGRENTKGFSDKHANGVPGGPGVNFDPPPLGPRRGLGQDAAKKTRARTCLMACLLIATFSTVPRGTADAGDFTKGPSKVPPLHAETAEVVQSPGPVVELYGVLYPKGHYVRFWFQWGRTARYGHITEPTFDEGFKAFGPEYVTADLFHLRPHTLYHYRIVGKNGRGKAYGADRTFKTVGRGERRRASGRRYLTNGLPRSRPSAQKL